MEKMTKKDRFKKFINDNVEGIASVTVALAASGVVVATLSKIAKAQHEANLQSMGYVENYNNWADRQNEWIDKQKEDGKMVYLLHDSSYLTVPNDTPVEWYESI